MRNITAATIGGARRWERFFPHFAPAQLFALISDIESYPAFVPGCVSARVVERGAKVWRVENVFRFGPALSRFTSIAAIDPPHALDISSCGGPWQDFHMAWRLRPQGNGCLLTCTSRLHFRSPALGALASLAAGEVERRVIAAFTARAEALYNVSRSPRERATIRARL